MLVYWSGDFLLKSHTSNIESACDKCGLVCQLLRKKGNNNKNQLCINAEFNCLFPMDDFVDSLKFVVWMWLFTYVGALFNGLASLKPALISLFTIPLGYEKHRVEIDHSCEINSTPHRGGG
uniref:Reticulon n=1 Tax=Podarcis muralis TaxID=64176 RepID=A0A670K9R5_PODMU